MIREVETTGKTIEEAIENAYAMLGVERDEVELSIEVIDRPKSGFLGIGSVPAKVKASYEVPDEPSSEPEYKIGRVDKPRRERPARQHLEATVIGAPDIEETPAPAPSYEAAEPVEEEQPRQANRGEGRRNRNRNRRERSEYAQPPVEHVEHVEKIPDVSDEELEARKNAAVSFLQGLLQRMDTETTVTAETNAEDKSVHIKLEGEHVGTLIGRRGETLGAIQHITGYMANKGQDERVRVIVDAEGYREKREEALQGLARRTALKAVRLRHNITLEPMNAYERHIIHTALQDWRDVSTFSTGAEPRRAVVIAYTPGGGKGSSGEGRSERPRRNDRRRNDRPRRDDTPAEPRKNTPLPEQVWE